MNCYVTDWQQEIFFMSKEFIIISGNKKTLVQFTLLGYGSRLFVLKDILLSFLKI